MREVLELLLAGEFTVDEALRALDAERVEVLDGLARLDPDRLRRKGVPEVVFAPGKSAEATAEIAAALLRSSGQALVSRVGPEHHHRLQELAAGAGVELAIYGSGRRLVSHPPLVPPAGPGGVGILAAGTADVDVAEEARMVVEGMGLRADAAYDVGASALHRLREPLQRMLRDGVDALVVAAGMEAALPTVVAGLVSLPVVAVPVSSGYGAGGRGLAALLALLQTCSPGVAVVNIDNGVGAGATAGLIAARAAAARAEQHAPAGRTGSPR